MFFAAVVVGAEFELLEDDDAAGCCAGLGLAPKSSGRVALRGETVALFEIRPFDSEVVVAEAVEVVLAFTVVEEDEVEEAEDEVAAATTAGAVFPLPLSDTDTGTDASCA